MLSHALNPSELKKGEVDKAGQTFMTIREIINLKNNNVLLKLKSVNLVAL